MNTAPYRLDWPVGHASFAVAVCLLAFLVLGGCADQAGGKKEANPLISAKQVELTKDLTIDAEFGNLTAVAVDRQGRIYGGDRQRQQIWRFGPGGSPLPAVGRMGKGPGEFTDVTDLVVARGDSLFVFDVQLQRVTVLEVGDSVRLARTVDLARSDERATYNILVPSHGPLLVQYAAPYTEANLDEPHSLNLRMVRPQGASGGESLEPPLLRWRDKEFLVTRDPQYGFSVGSLPYGRESMFRLGPEDKIFAGWSDSLSVRIFNLRGEQVGGFHRPRPELPVTTNDINGLLASYSSDMFGQMSRAVMDRGIKEDKLPETRPAYHTFLVDDAGRLWFKVLTASDLALDTGSGLNYIAVPKSPNTTMSMSPWWIFSRTGERLAVAELPSNVMLRTIRDGSAYGTETDSLGVQSIVRYKVPAGF